MSLNAGLSADEFNLYSGVTNIRLKAYYQNFLTGNIAGVGSEYWTELYNYIFICNSAIEGLEKSNSLTLAVKNQLIGEAKFMRAFFLFLFGQFIW